MQTGIHCQYIQVFLILRCSLQLNVSHEECMQYHLSSQALIIKTPILMLIEKWALKDAWIFMDILKIYLTWQVLLRCLKPSSVGLAGMNLRI